ncbi:MAG: hypothetical protein AAF493_22790 [Pseudomonadota bacterium]
MSLRILPPGRSHASPHSEVTHINPLIRFLAGLRRIISLTEDLMFLIGRSLQRRAMRNGILVAAAYGSTLVGIKLGSSSQLSNEKILALVAIAFASYPAGVILVRLSNFLTRGNIVAAAGGFLHLTSHFKQSHRRAHLGRLWDHVYRHEAMLQRTVDDVMRSRDQLQATKEAIHDWIENLPDSIRTAMQLQDARRETALIERILSGYPHDSDIEATRELFILSGIYALGTPMPQKLQASRVGFDLSPLEDWYEKGLFTLEDYPAKAFERDPLMRQIFSMIRPTWWHRIESFLAIEPSASFWYTFTTRKLGVLTGRAIGELNSAAALPLGTGYFNTQHLLWPSRELDAEVIKDFPIDGERLLQMLQTKRLANVHQLFSDNPAIARHHVCRMFLGDYQTIVKVRLRFDVEYAGGHDQFNPREAIATFESDYGLSVLSSRVLHRLTDAAERTLHQVDAVVDAHGVTGARETRALRMAYHLNFHGLASACREDIGSTRSAAAVRAALDCAPMLNHALVRLRLYEVLALLQIATYAELIESLLQSDITA